MPAHFTPESMTFLKGLARHNDREWFNARKDVYERALKVPMLAVVDEVTQAMQAFAPDHMRPANKIMMRIYRDTRFSKNKLPYKTNLAAWWSRLGMEKTSGGGFYLQVSATELFVAAGVYMPEREQLLQLRRWMSANHAAYRKLLTRTMKTRGLSFAGIDAQALTRMPKGFAADDPADELIRATNWGVRASLPHTLATGPTLVREIAKRLRAAAPLVAQLNEALQPAVKRKPLF